MTLREYQHKRDFTRTKEPPPRKPAKAAEAHRFVVQKHDASRLHYDFRLEMDGVLKSWAVPKGFPTTKGERHLAVHVEDHPVEYENFEGIIPQGEYGGGTVMVWDVGTYEVSGDAPTRALHEGKLHLCLKGKKLRGEWTLVRTRSDDEKEHWLLMKTGDSVPAISAKRDDQSVLTRRTMRQIAEQKAATWRSSRDSSEDAGTRKTTKPSQSKAKGQSKASTPVRSSPKKSRSTKPLTFIEPMKAKLVAEPPSFGDWVYELKWDGYRALAIKDGDTVEIYSRNQKSLTADFPEVRDAVLELPVERAILDGEIVALDKDGKATFQLLQARAMGSQRPAIFYYAFDLLRLKDRSLLKEPLHVRKAELEKLIAGAETIRYSATLQGDVHEALKQIRKMGLEGVIGKLRNSVYEAGARSGAWIKVKCVAEQEFVIGGFTEPRGTRSHLGALHVGYYEGKQLRYAGKVGTGFNQKLLSSIRKKLDGLLTDKCPFAETPSTAPNKWARIRGHTANAESRWVRPELVCQVKFTEWTGDGILRQPVFLGLRSDKNPREVIREKPEQ